MGRRTKSPRLISQNGKAATRQPSEGVLSWLLTFAVGVLLLARWLVPTESASQGDTLWLVQLWLAAGIIWVWAFARGETRSIRVGACDFALWLLIGGHVASALVLVATEGDKRAAVNMLWEWVGFGVMFFVVRQTIRNLATRRQLLVCAVSAAVGVAGLGVWQHYVWYGASLAAYEQIRGELDELEGTSAVTGTTAGSVGEQRKRELQLELIRQGIPLDGRARFLWEQRLRSSTEPFGLFALANTLAGFLVAWLIVLLGVQWPRPNRLRSHVVWWLAILLTAFCLVLTKSRTAWVGLAVGLCVLSWQRWPAFRSMLAATFGNRHDEATDSPPHSSGLPVRRLPWVGGGVAAVAGILLIASWSGGFDQAVLREAPKSLQYRFEYWTGTSSVIRERPLFGTGPGNFRQHYLRHKLPESSEEIADPHNCFLDVWANGGIVALAGLLAIVGVAFWAFRRRMSIEETLAGNAGASGPKSDRSLPPLVLGAGTAYVLVFGVSMLIDGVADYRLLMLLAAFVAFLALWWAFADGPSFGEHVRVSNTTLGAAALGLLVHLLGAGGIAMPAIVQTLLLLLALATASRPVGRISFRSSFQDHARLAPGEDGPGRRIPLVRPSAACTAIGALAVSLFVACLITAMVPVMNRKTLIRLGDADFLEDRNFRAATVRYQQAALADPLSTEPWERLAAATFEEWRSVEGRLSSDFASVIESCRQAIARDPHSANQYRRAGEFSREEFQRTRTRADAWAASEFLIQAIDRYPSNAALQYETAVACVEAGRTAAATQHAERALDLDRISRQAGHVDKYLPVERIDRLRSMLSDGQMESRGGHGGEVSRDNVPAEWSCGSGRGELTRVPMRSYNRRITPPSLKLSAGPRLGRPEAMRTWNPEGWSEASVPAIERNPLGGMRLCDIDCVLVF